MDNQQKYCYWRRSWNKWLILGIAALKAVMLWFDVKEYREIVSLNIFSPEKLEEFVLQQQSLFLIDGLLIASLLGVFFIGTFAHSRKAAKLGEAVVLLADAVAMAVWAAVWNRALDMMPVYVMLAAVTLAGAAYTFYEYHREKRKQQSSAAPNIP